MSVVTDSAAGSLVWGNWVGRCWEFEQLAWESAPAGDYHEKPQKIAPDFRNLNVGACYFRLHGHPRDDDQPDGLD